MVNKIDKTIATFVCFAFSLNKKHRSQMYSAHFISTTEHVTLFAIAHLQNTFYLAYCLALP